MKLGLMVAISVIAGLPLCAEAQQPSPAKAKAAAQKVVKMIIDNKAKSQIHILKAVHQRDIFGTQFGRQFVRALI